MSDKNELTLYGKIAKTEFVYTSKKKNEKFYQLNFEVDRLSEAKDVLPIICSEKLLYDLKLDENSDALFVITGSVRTRNYTDDNGKSHLSIYGYADNVEKLDESGIEKYNELKEKNIVELEGHICKPVNKRKTNKSNRIITDTLIAVNRPYNRSDYIPCIAWGRNAKLAGGRSVGDKVSIVGRFQSRTYYKKDSDQPMTAYEVSISDLTVIENVEKKEKENNGEEKE